MVSSSVCIICLIGPPASGKTTLAKKIKCRYKSVYMVDIVNFDDEIFFEGDNSWKEKRGFVRDSVVSSLIKHSLHSRNQSLIVLDDNMFYSSMRYEYYQLARKFQTGFCQIYMSTPLHICLELNRKRFIPVPEGTVLKINGVLEVPDPSRNSWENNSLIITSVLNSNEIWERETWVELDLMIQQCLLNPIKQIPNSSRERKPVSPLHSADLALRKLVNILIADRKDKCNWESYRKELMTRRKILLDRMRSGALKLPESSKEENIPIYIEFLRPHLTERENTKQ